MLHLSLIINKLNKKADGKTYHEYVSNKANVKRLVEQTKLSTSFIYKVEVLNTKHRLSVVRTLSLNGTIEQITVTDHTGYGLENYQSII